jgi:hypothetical protein
METDIDRLSLRDDGSTGLLALLLRHECAGHNDSDGLVPTMVQLTPLLVQR